MTIYNNGTNTLMTNYNNGKYFGDSPDCLQYLEIFSSRNVKLYHILWSIPVNKFMAIKEIIFSVCQCCWYCLKMNTITNGNILRWKMEKVEQHDGGCCKGGSKQHSTQETLDGEQVPLHDDGVEDNDEDVAREAPNNIQFSQFYFHMQSLTSREVSGPPQEMVRKTGSSSSSWGSINPDPTYISTLPLSLPWEFSLMCPSKGHWCQPKRQWWIHWLALCSQVGSPPGCSPTASGELTSVLGLLLPKNEIKVK